MILRGSVSAANWSRCLARERFVALEKRIPRDDLAKKERGRLGELFRAAAG